MRVRKEEYTSLGDFIKNSFDRDQLTIMMRFPKLNETFLAEFTAQLEEVKVLESGLVLTQEQKSVTMSLYNEAEILNKELNFVKSYISHAGLNTEIIVALKEELVKSNIEGAVLKVESLKQFITTHLPTLVNEGMNATFPNILDAHKISMSEKNAAQNQFMNSRKALTDANKVKYQALYRYILKISEAGRLVFDGTIQKDEYSLTKTIGRMRSAKQNEANKAA
ncbi:MAG: hypothetical protein ABI426_02400 [Flavobacterium sp.]